MIWDSVPTVERIMGESIDENNRFNWWDELGILL